MYIRQLFFIMSIYVSMTPLTVIAATDMVDACQTVKASNTLTQATVKVLTLNISHGRNTALNQIFVSKARTYENLDKIASLLREVDVDVVALQEADAPSRWSGKFDHVAYIAEQAGFPCRVHGRHSQSWISSYGTALLSRAQSVDSTSVRFPPSWPSKQKGYVSATFDWTIEPKRVPVTLTSVHFDFLSKNVRNRQVLEMVAGLSDLGGPLILMGDFNSQWEDDTSHVQMLVDELGLRAYYPGHSGLGTYKGPTGKRLDWILISPELEFVEYKVMPEVVADHFAVYAEIAYRGHQE